MKAILVLLLFFTQNCNYKKEQIAIKPSNELKWLLAGLPDELKEKNIVAKLYGFQFQYMGGCSVSKKCGIAFTKKIK